MEGAIIGGLGVFAAIMIIFVLGLVIASVVFWIWSLIDVLTRTFREEYEKLVWVLVIIFTGFLGSVIYYFVGVPRGTKDTKTKATSSKTVKSDKTKKKGTGRKS